MSNKIRIDQSIQTFDVSIEYEGETYIVQPTVFSTISDLGGGNINEIDGGTPDSVYLVDQFIDGGDITV